MQVIVIDPGKRTVTQQRLAAGEDELRQLQVLVGGYVERVTPRAFPEHALLVDEDARIKADAACRPAFCLAGFPRAILGTAVVVGAERTPGGSLDWVSAEVSVHRVAECVRWLS